MSGHRASEDRESVLSASLLMERLAYEPDTGLFRWRLNRVRALIGAVAGTVATKGYRQIYLGNRPYMAHRLAWLFVYGKWPSEQIDHINGEKDDNRIANLRLATPSQNIANTRRRSDNGSGVKGVSWHKRTGLWHARIMKDGVNKFLGAFAEKGDAATAYRRAASEAHGKFANFGATA